VTPIRVTGGALRGRKFATAPGEIARYTSSMVRQAIFNIIGNVEGLKVLDLFCGSGSFSVEALSRGAASATGVEKERAMFSLLKKNMETLLLQDRTTLLNMDVKDAIPFLRETGRLYDIIFLDPPYRGDFIRSTMTLLNMYRLDKPHGAVILEQSKKEEADASFFGIWEKDMVRYYGDTAITILKTTDQRRTRSLP
jgi:16S rRNA (guanine966-N2)-methyltransferase